MPNASMNELLARPDQTLYDHLTHTAELAERFADSFQSGSWGRAIGLLHDIGKASAPFQQRVRGETDRKVDHSTAGARHASETWKHIGTLLAYCIAGHHAGLPDGQGNEASSLAHRLDPDGRPLADYSAWRECLGELAAVVAPNAFPFNTRGKGLGFRLAFFVRMLFSCLVDADRLDAEAVGDPERASRRGTYPTLAELADRLDTYLAQFTADTPVRRVRAEVLHACREAAELPPGLFSLTVPTGGGKTLSSLAFALRHALAHGLCRVVYVIPYTSIIEQNAAVFRQALGDVNGEFVVEHHSNLVPDENDGDDRPHPATENWDAPVIVTTAVQFFESLYSHKAGRCRKLHNLARSVIILDEAQMLPLNFLLPCIEALREISATYASSVVLCTATQPALNASDDPNVGLKGGLEGVREIMVDPVALHASLERVTVSHAGELSDCELAKRLSAEPQALCIVNTRRQARKLYDALRGDADEPAGLYHLSALMCPRHRTNVLASIRQALADGLACRVVSTTLVEAGVDVDFPVVYRAEGGLDSIAQAAGRCNREGRLARGTVHVFRPEGGPPAGHFKRAVQAARSVADNHADDLLHPDAVRDYFLELYWQLGADRLDEKNIINVLTDSANKFMFPFREVGNTFMIIDSAAQGLIIPIDDAARDVVRALDALESGARAGGLLRRAQRHTVSVYSRELQRLEHEGAVRRTGPGGQFFVLANMSLYSPLVGLDVFRDASGVFAPEDLLA